MSAARQSIVGYREWESVVVSLGRGVFSFVAPAVMGKTLWWQG